MKTVAGLITILVLFPVRLYLMWYVLKAVNASELPMFLFWATVPLGLLAASIGEILKRDEDKI